MALDESAWDAMLDAENQGAKGGPGAGSSIYRLAQAGKVKFYPAGLKVRVIRATFAARLVEVLEGEDRGDRGWVQAEFVTE